MSSSPTARLRRLREDEYADWLATSKAGYVDGMAEHAGMPRAAARRKADEDFPRVLPNGLATAGHAIYVVEVDGVPVGRLWLAERENHGQRALYIYEIEIAEAFRGRGLGRQAMLLAEDEARRLGLGRIELNVFGGNGAARTLYRSLGYEETSVQMAKELGPGP